jgi:hypothetical protein
LFRPSAAGSPQERDMTNSGSPGERPGQWGLVALAWVLVGVPLVWGVWNTLLKAAALFQ